MVGDLVEAGELTWAQAEEHPDAHEITTAVGVGDKLDIDKRRGDVRPRDRFLLCSDGLTRHVAFPEIERTLTITPTQASAGALLRRALDAGGTDNISVIVVET